MSSGAGLNRVNYPFFFVMGAGGIPVSQPLSNVNGTYDSGPLGVEAYAFSKWGFQLTGAFTQGWTVTFYGTLDQTAYVAWQAKIQNLPAVSVPSTSWAVLPSPSEQSGTGVGTNPLTSTGLILPYNLSGLVAVRAVAVANSADEPLQAWMLAIP